MCFGQVRWLHNSAPVTDGRYEVLSADTMHALHIRQVSANDAGTFTVVAGNSLGTASHSARLAINVASLSKRHRPERDHWPVNGTAEPTASLQQREPASRRSPASSERQQAVVSSAPFKVIPGCLLFRLWYHIYSVRRQSNKSRVVLRMELWQCFHTRLSVCPRVCLSCSCSNFGKPWSRNFILDQVRISRSLGRVRVIGHLYSALLWDEPIARDAQIWPVIARRSHSFTCHQLTNHTCL